VKSQSEKSDQAPAKTGTKKIRHTPTRGYQNAATNKNNKTKTTKHTIEFSNNKTR
jgi:hypothetical protein